MNTHFDNLPHVYTELYLCPSMYLKALLSVTIESVKSHCEFTSSMCVYSFVETSLFDLLLYEV